MSPLTSSSDYIEAQNTQMILRAELQCSSYMQPAAWAHGRCGLLAFDNLHASCRSP